MNPLIHLIKIFSILLINCIQIKKINNNELNSLGNFKETCNLLAKFYPEFAQKYKEKTNYTSHGIQNELISRCANILRETIIN